MAHRKMSGRKRGCTHRVAAYSVMKVLLSSATLGGGHADRARPKSRSWQSMRMDPSGRVRALTLRSRWRTSVEWSALSARSVFNVLVRPLVFERHVAHLVDNVLTMIVAQPLRPDNEVQVRFHELLHEISLLTGLEHEVETWWRGVAAAERNAVRCTRVREDVGR
jgi:hypothetical protein